MFGSMTIRLSALAVGSAGKPPPRLSVAAALGKSSARRASFKAKAPRLVTVRNVKALPLCCSMSLD